MWLQMLRSPKTCSQQADDLGEATFMSSLSSKAWEPEHLWCKFQSEVGKLKIQEETRFLSKSEG